MAIEGTTESDQNFSIFSQLFEEETVRPLSDHELAFTKSKGDFTRNFTKQELKAFMDNLSWNISTMIEKHKEEDEKAARRLRASAEGEDYHDVE